MNQNIPDLAEMQRRKRARRTAARTRKTPEHQYHLPPHTQPHHAYPPHQAFHPYPDQNIQHYPPAPPYDFDANAGHMEGFYHGYDPNTPGALPENQYAQNHPVYHQPGYDQYHYHQSPPNHNNA
jgi:hypothetical protein